ncbi:hypothetical protein ABPG75_002689 [Micractinium tetrahymenae]
MLQTLLPKARSTAAAPCSTASSRGVPSISLLFQHSDRAGQRCLAAPQATQRSPAKQVRSRLAAMASGRPVIDQKAAEQMNLNVLRRIDPQVDELLATAGHVALYDFDIPTKRWSRKDVEGSLFLVKRRSQPRFQFIILNKKSAVGTDNFVEDVHGGFQCEVQKPYVLYRNRANEVVGIWFYDDADCDHISALLQRIASTFAAPSEAGAGAAAVALVPALTADDSAAAKGAGGDDAFWDRRVVVPEDGPGASLLRQPTQQPNGQPALLAPSQLQQQAAAELLTPQLLQQAAASAAAPAPAEAAPEAAAGTALLQSLLRGSAAATAAAAGPALPAAPVLPLPHPVDITEAADRALRSKVSSLLSSLANNEAFCSILAAELKKAGLV